MTTRRGFLGAMLAAASAPAIVKSSSLMKIWVPSQELFIFGPVTHESFTATQAKAQRDDYIDNLARSMKHTSALMMGLIPTIHQ